MVDGRGLWKSLSHVHADDYAVALKHDVGITDLSKYHKWRTAAHMEGMPLPPSNPSFESQSDTTHVDHAEESLSDSSGGFGGGVKSVKLSQERMPFE
jgi:hypothetical protein